MVGLICVLRFCVVYCVGVNIYIFMIKIIINSLRTALTVTTTVIAIITIITIVTIITIITITTT